MTTWRSPNQRNPAILALVDYYGGDYQTSFLDAAEQAANALGFDLIACVGRSLQAPVPADQVQNEIFNLIDSRHCAGVVVGSGCIANYVSIEQLARHCERYRPLPVCSVSVQVAGVPSVVVGNRRGMKIAVDHLIEEHGCERIAHVRGPLTSVEAEQRLLGYRDSLTAHGLDYDPAFVEVGNFWIDGGESAMQRLIERRLRLDAVVTANDYTALGVMQALRANRIRVPHQIRVVGFDDVPLSRIASPALTTMRQPIPLLVRLAVEGIHRMATGGKMDLLQELDVELVRRQSCGCGYNLDRDRVPVRSSTGSRPTVLELLAPHHGLRRELVKSTQLGAEALEGWADRLIDALGAEFSGSAGRFHSVLEDLLDEAQPDADRIECFYPAAEALRQHFSTAAFDTNLRARLEDLWHTAVVLVGDASRRSHLRARYDTHAAIGIARRCVECLSTALTPAALVEALDVVFELSKVRAAAVSLYEDDSRARLRPLGVFGRSLGSEVLSASFPSENMAPEGFFTGGDPKSHVAMPLNHGSEHLGVLVLSAGSHYSLYAFLREHIGAAIKATALHRSVVLETAARERAERQQAERDVEIAKQIQTAILPTDCRVRGLEVGAIMQAAANVGGDYYDVIPTSDGAWLGIGDVSGHGLMAGMIMLMIQSMVRSTVSFEPSAQPRDLVLAINRALFDNIRERLKRNDYATFCLFRYAADGHLTFAGGHEPLFVCKARTGRCEIVDSQGFWLGSMQDVAHLTAQDTLQLEAGDLLVLYTDGITEPMNAEHEQFGLERLCTVIERHREQSAPAICEAVVRAVRAWSAAPADDLTILVARYRGEP